MLNIVGIEGRLTKDIELKVTTSGKSVATFTVACDRDYVPKGEQRQADFIDVVVWGVQAEQASKFFCKGDAIAITGRIRTRNYEDKDGNKRKAVEVEASGWSFCGGKSNKGEAQVTDLPTDDAPSEDLPF